jgi:hypothetical protein
VTGLNGDDIVFDTTTAEAANPRPKRCCRTSSSAARSPATVADQLTYKQPTCDARHRLWRSD